MFFHSDVLHCVGTFFILFCPLASIARALNVYRVGGFGGEEARNWNQIIFYASFGATLILQAS